MGTRQREIKGKIWDNCNSKINKIYLKNDEKGPYFKMKKKKDKVRELTLADFKTYYKATVN